MKRLKSALAVLLSVCLVASASATNLTGKIFVNGNAQANLQIQFQLNAPNVVAGVGAFTTTPFSCWTDALGNIVSTPNPLVAPVVSTNTASGTLGAGTFYTVIAYWDATGVTAISPETTTVLGSTGSLIVTAPALQRGSGYKIYIGTSSGGETLQATVTGFTNYTQSSALSAGSAVPSSNTTVCAVQGTDTFYYQPAWWLVSVFASNGNKVPGGISRTGRVKIMGATADVSAMLPDYAGDSAIIPTPIIAQPTAGAAQNINGALSVNGIFTLSALSPFRWGSSGVNASDTGLSRDSAGVIDVGNGTQGDFSGSVKAFNHIAKGDPNYDVKAFGAKGDGSTDDTTAIQQAINYACTGATTAPASNTCTSWISGTALGGEVYFPAGDYHISAPLIIYGGIRLVGAGKLVSKITKTTNTVGTLASITAGTGVGRSPTACGGSPCVDNFNVDAIIEVPYISSGNTDYAYRWTIRDLALYGSGTNGTKYGIYAPRSAQAEMKNLYIFMNCSQGAPANCGSVQGSAFYTEDAWLMRHEGVTVDSSWIAWNHVNDGSGIGSGTSAIFSDDWGVNIGCSGFHFFGLSYSSMLANAVDHYNKKGTDLAASDNTCVPYSFSSVSGMSVNGGGAEDLVGGVVAVQGGSSVVISGGFKTFTQVGYTSGATLATLFVDNSTITMNGTTFSAVTSPGNIFNMVIQNTSFVNDTNSVLPSGGNSFISYGGGSVKSDFNSGVMTFTNASGSSTGTKTFATGTAAMTTAAISSGACGTTVTVASSQVVTTDVIDVTRNAAATIANGGGLTLNAWPTAGNVNFNYCNSSAGTITPTAMTVNWSVRR